MSTYTYAPRRDYRSSDGSVESREPLPMHEPEYWAVLCTLGDYRSWIADFMCEEDANAFCELKNKEV